MDEFMQIYTFLHTYIFYFCKKKKKIFFSTNAWLIVFMVLVIILQKEARYFYKTIYVYCAEKRKGNEKILMEFCYYCSLSSILFSFNINLEHYNLVNM